MGFNVREERILGSNKRKARPRGPDRNKKVKDLSILRYSI